VFDNAVIDRIENLPFIEKINYKCWVNTKTGQEFIKHHFNYNGINFKWDDYKLEITIKPHYYFNDGVHNANDFTSIDSVNVLKHIFTLLNLNDCLESLKIVGLEYGVNFNIGLVDTMLMEEIYLHRTNLFYNIKDLPFCKVSYKPNTNGKANQHKQFKFYGKAIQHPNHCDPYTMRAEVRSNRSAYINQLGIYTALDVLNINNYTKLRDDLISETKHLLFNQNITSTKGLTPLQKRDVKKKNDPKYWIKILKNNRSKFSRAKQQYFNLLNKTGYNLTSLVINGITKKANQMHDLECGQTLSTPSIKKCGVTSTYSIGRDLTTFKICTVTELDISMQRDESYLLSNTGLQHLERNDLKEFERIKGIFLTGNYNKFETDIYSMISKQIRNRLNNNRDYYNSSQTALF
jgi:hypothetical protein